MKYLVKNFWGNYFKIDENIEIWLNSLLKDYEKVEIKNVSFYTVKEGENEYLECCIIVLVE